MKSPSLASAAPQRKQLHKQLRLMAQGIDQGMDWVENTRHQAPRLDIEAQGLLIKLRRTRIHALALSTAALAPLALGFYGQSQAGKNHLISALSAGVNGKADTMPDLESTAIVARSAGQFPDMVVTRFSRQAETLDPDYPVRLQLLAEIEVVKILATLGLTGPAPGIVPDRKIYGDRLNVLLQLRQSAPLTGISGDDMVALWDYLTRQRGLHHAPRFNDQFWLTAIDLAPFLRIDDRARLFSLFWGDNAELTAIYRQLAHELQALKGSFEVLAPLAILSQDALPSDGVRVRPLLAEKARAPITLAADVVWLLAVERLVPLEGPCRWAKLEQVDLLDFPVGDGDAAVVDNEEHSSAWLPALREAKRTYLLTRYTDRRELCLLMICNAVGQKSAVKSVGQALSYWVEQTQGAKPLGATHRKPGLIWVVTPFDQHSSHARHHDAAVQRMVGSPGDAWGTMLTLDAGGLDRMADYLSVELSLEAKLGRLTDRFDELRRELADNLLGRWYQPAGETDSVAKPRIAETLLKVLQTRAGVHGELLEKLLPTRDDLRPLYLHSPATATNHQPQEPGTEISPLMDNPSFGVGIFIDLLDDSPIDVHRPPVHGIMPGVVDNDDYERAFARRVMHYWINYLRNLPDNGPLAALLGLTKAQLEMLMEEFITATYRLKLGEVLLRALIDDGSSGATEGKTESKADRQVAQTLTVLGDFIAWLGFQGTDTAQRPDSRVNPGHKIFERIAIAPQDWGNSQRLTRLSLAPVNTTAYYIFDWLVGLKALIIQNAGYTGSEELPAEARLALGKIMALIGPPLTIPTPS